MPLRGAAIGPDAVLVWTGARELTRFDRAGRRASFTIPLAALASHIDVSGLRVVDARGTIHRYSLAGAHLGATPLATAREGIAAAALAATCDRIAVLVGDEVEVHDGGAPLPWPIERPLDGYRETGAELSADGELLLVAYETFSYATSYGSGGNNGTGVHVYHRDGTRRIELYDSTSVRDTNAVLSPDGNHVIADESWPTGRYVYAVGVDGVDWTIAHETPLQLAFRGPLVAVLVDGELIVVELATRRRATLAVPEHFSDLVLTDDDVVLVHAELGAWWIPLATLVLEADA